MIKYNFKCDNCTDVKTIEAKDTKAIISHPFCGIYRYLAELNSGVKTTKSKIVAIKPFKPMLENPNVIGKNIEISPYIHPKINLVETYRCPTCFENEKCPLGFEEKTWCLIKFMSNFKTSNPTTEGVLSMTPSEFEIIKLDDIKQKINVYDIVRLFINRDDKYSIQNIDPNDPTKDTFPDKNKTLTYDIIVNSLKGQITIGIRPVNPVDNTIKWICWDLDKQHNENPRALAQEMVKDLRAWYGLTGYTELSGSVDSFHVWIFISPIDNKIGYDFDQNFRTRLKSIGIGTNPKSIERGVQTGDSGMIKLPFNIQRKQKYGKKGGRSRFIEGVDISKITPERLPAPWVNSTIENNTFQPAAEEKIEPQKVSNIVNEIFINNEKIDVLLKCNKCTKGQSFTEVKPDDIINRIKIPHKDCGGNIKIGIVTYETSIEILKNNTDSVKTFCNKLMDSPNKKTYFDYDIRQTSNSNYENILVLITKSEKDGKELAGWLSNSAALKNKLYKPAPQPFKVEKVYDFSFNYEKMYGEEN